MQHLAQKSVTSLFTENFENGDTFIRSSYNSGSETDVANVKLYNLHFEKGKKYVLKYDYKTSGVTNLKDYPILGYLSDGIISIIPRDDNQWASAELEWKTLTIEFEASKTNDAIRVGFYNDSATFEHFDIDNIQIDAVS